MKILQSIRREQRKIKSEISKLEKRMTALGAAAAALGPRTGIKPGTKLGRTSKKKGKMSTAGRAAISKATKARWAKWRAARKAKAA